MTLRPHFKSHNVYNFICISLSFSAQYRSIKHRQFLRPAHIVVRTCVYNSCYSTCMYMYVHCTCIYLLLLRQKDAFNCIHISIYTTTIKSAHVRTCRVLRPLIESIMYRRMYRCTFSLYTMSIDVGNVDMYDLHRDQETTVAVKQCQQVCVCTLLLEADA